MINYVNNSFDKVLKPCDAQKFMELTQSELTEKLILGHRAGEKNSKAKLPALTYMGALDEPRYRDYLAQCEEQGTKPLGSRRAEFMRPTGLLMLDFDHVGRPTRDGVTLSNAKSLAESPGEKGLLGETKVSFVATDAHSASAQREIPLCARDDRDAVIDSPVKMWEQICKGASERGFDLGQCLALAHITPSGDGLRLVVTRDKGKTIAECQYRWTHEVLPWLGVNVKCDDVCKDISRLSFAPMQKEILYFNPSLLFGELPEASDYPDGTLWGGVSFRDGVIPSGERDLAKSQAKSQREILRVAQNDIQDEASYDTEYNGVPYSDIVARLEEQLGGKPERGARNSFIFTMACNLRYICDDNAEWVASILPTYGEEPQKHRMTIQSAINRPMSREMPETLKRALGVAKACADNSQLTIHNSQLPPALPSVLPAPIELLTSRTPDKMKPAVAMSVFPALGAHLRGVLLRYWDGRDYEPAFMHVLAAELSAGKSAVNLPIDYIIADIEARDEVARHKEAEWKERCATLKTTEDKPTRPKGLAVQVLSADMTNAAFVQRLADAEGKFLYTQMSEIELLDSLKTNTRGGAVSAILRLAFDCDKYGQERVASNAINAKVRVRWNWNASTTIQRVRKYFAKSIADGTLSRLSFATIIKDDDDWGEQRPRYSQYGQPFADALAPYIDRLTTCSGTLVCPEAIAWAEQMSDEQIAYAREMDDRSYAQYSYRSVLMGFYRAMVLYIAGGMQWTSEIAEFASWSVRYDMWCKMRFFADMIHKDMADERAAVQRGPVSLLALLPREFTRQQVQDVRVAQGLKPNPKNMLAQWVYRGFVHHDTERGVYLKVER